jgi:hypothetical protein
MYNEIKVLLPIVTGGVIGIAGSIPQMLLLILFQPVQALL